MGPSISILPATSILEPEIDREEILSHLHEILADRRFASAERNATFLRFVVESTLNGKAGEIKETVIATEVYGRPSSYDPKTDSIVRVEASRLRQKLRNYYENEGRNSPIRLRLPSGTYVPSFEKLNDTPVPQVTPADIIPEPAARRLSWKNTAAVAAAFGLLAVWFLVHPAGGSKTTDWQREEATAAWREGVALMALDPHTAQTVSGPPATILRAIERLEFSVARCFAGAGLGQSGRGLRLRLRVCRAGHLR